MEETSDAVQHVDKLVSASARIISRLEGEINIGCTEMHDTDRNKDPNSRKNCIRRWECLRKTVRVDIPHDKIC